MIISELENQQKETLRVSKEKLTACMFDLVVLMENVKHTLKHVTETIECVRDRLGELERMNKHD